MRCLIELRIDLQRMCFGPFGTLLFLDDFAKEFGLLPGQIVDLNVENGVLTIRKNYEHYKT